MEVAITVAGKILGQRQTLFDNWVVFVEEPQEHLTLRDLITRIVREEVVAFRQRQEQRRLPQILTRSEIERGAAAGKVDMGGRDLAQDVDPEAAVDAALQAFADGLYYVFVDDQQVERLDTRVTLRPSSRVTFVRLVLLAGG